MTYAVSDKELAPVFFEHGAHFLAEIGKLFLLELHHHSILQTFVLLKGTTKIVLNK